MIRFTVPPLLALSALLALVVGLQALAAAAEPLTLDVKKLPLNPENAAQTSVGPLVWRGSLEISSSDRRFGGLSGLLIERDGRGLLANSDSGHWISARLKLDDRGFLEGLEAAEIGALQDSDGRPLISKRAGDAEALARLPDGTTLVAFEQAHRIWRYPAGKAPLARPPQAYPAPPGVDRLQSNGGLEAVTELPRGGLLALVEENSDSPTLPGFLWQNGKWAELALTRIGPYRPTGAATLPSGDVLVLERRFSFIGGLGIKLRRLPLAKIKPGATLEGEVVAELHPPLIYDNMEGIAALEEPGGGVRIYLIADDNFNPTQRTVLMSFLLPGE